MSFSKNKDNISLASKDDKPSRHSSVGAASSSLTSLKTLREEISHYVETEGSITSNQYPGIERTDYDYAVERHNPYATNLLEATSYLVKVCFGVGILNMHIAFMFGGMLASAVGSVVVAILLSVSMSKLVLSAQKMYATIRVSRLSYADLCEAAVAICPWKDLRQYSKKFRYALECFIFLQMTGTCSIYQIIIANTMTTIIPFTFNVHLSLRTYIFIVTIPLILVCLITNWKYLAPISIVADLFLAICIITTMFYSVAKADNIYDRPLWKSIPGLFKFFGICLYSMDGIPQVMSIENNMRSPQHIRFVIHMGMLIVFFAVTATGFFGYWGWGEHCRSPVTIHMPMETIPIILHFLVAFMLTASFAIRFWVPFRIVWHYIGKTYEDGFSKKNKWDWFYRVIYLLLITCLSSLYPHPEKLMIFLGSFFVSINSFVFPSFLQTLVGWRQCRGHTTYLLLNDFLLCIVGIVFCVGGLYSLYYF